MLVDAVGAQAIKVTGGSTHYRHIVVELALFPGSYSAQVISFSLKVLLGRAEFVLDKDAYSSSSLEDAKDEITFAIGIR